MLQEWTIACVSPEHRFQYDIIQESLHKTKTKSEYRRVLCVWLRMSLSLSASQIATALGMTPAAVRKVHSRYFREGPKIFHNGKRGGRTRAYLSRERETQILKQFLRQARRGQSLNIQQIKNAYELSAGKKVAYSTIYRMIERHDMRRFLPRGRLCGGRHV